MISRFPRWVEAGAFGLALIAGYVNAIGLLGLEHQSISHMSGSATLVAIRSLDEGGAFKYAGVLLSFVLGAAMAGVILEGASLKLGKHYDSILTLESILLILALVGLDNDISYGYLLAAVACGLQNAMVTTYSGAIIRTTHITGIITDLGLMLGQRLKGRKVDARRALLYLIIVLGFILGGVAGAFFWWELQFKSLFVPAAACLLMAILYNVYRRIVVLPNN